MNWFFGTATPDAAATNGEKNDVPTTDSTENTNKRATTGSSRGQTWSSWWRGGAKEGNNTQADTSKPDVHRRKVSLASKHAKTIFGAMATGVEESTRMEKRTGVVLGLSVIVMAIVSAALVFPWWPLYIVFSIHLCIFGSIMIVIELPDVKWSRKIRKWVFRSVGFLRWKRARGVFYAALGVTVGCMYPYELWLRIAAIAIGSLLFIFGVLEMRGAAK